MKQAYFLKPATPAEKRSAAKDGVTLQPEYLDAEEAETIEAVKAGHYVKASQKELDALFPPRKVARS